MAVAQRDWQFGRLRILGCDETSRGVIRRVPSAPQILSRMINLRAHAQWGENLAGRATPAQTRRCLLY